MKTVDHSQPSAHMHREDLTLLRSVLEPLLEPHGFTFVDGGRDRGSGGDFATVGYVRGERRLELWWRFDLLTATYVDGQTRLEHPLYMSLLGARTTKRFPCLGNLAEQLQGLANDLERHGLGFLDPASDEIRRLAAEHARNPERFRGLRGL